MEQLVTYEAPSISIADEKVRAIANKPFPYSHLADDRRFEELIYSLIVNKMGDGTFPDINGVSLMTGVRDKGRDCALTKGGKNYGLVQCKKYKAHLGKSIFGEEITKFVMYSLLDGNLIADRDDFTYYIAVSEGFVLECSDFIDDFNLLIAEEIGLESWIDKNLRHPRLASLKVDNIESEVRDILTRIKVQKIYPQDLDSYLYEPRCRHIQSLFFEVRTVVDNSAVEELSRELQAFTRGQLDKNQIQKELSAGSGSLKHENNEFDGIPDSHLPRKETKYLNKWLKEPLVKDNKGKEQNICLLAGNAGIGKTVILRDLYEELSAEGIPILGLKADKLYATSIIELQQKIGLPIPVFQFIEQCKQQYKMVVLVIDQIDALSQAMSANRSFLDVYKLLIDRYTYDPNVRLIISVRLFDLHNDPSLRVYKNIETITVSPLSDQEVYGMLEKLHITPEQVSAKLLKLLRIPNQLNIFVRIVPSFSGSLGITNIQELYNELWKQKINVKPRTVGLSTSKTKQLLYKLVKKMYQNQRISLSDQLFEDYIPEISYLYSERILKKENNQLQFFHQSFYDFVFAKRFVEKDANLLKYIHTNEQSIMIRSALKMILNYLRDYDQEKYIEIISLLLRDQEVLYHVKHMLVSMLAFVEHPIKKEKEIIASVFDTSIYLSSHFFEQAFSESWFEYILHINELSFFVPSSIFKNHDYADLPTDEDRKKIQIDYLHHNAKIFLSRFVNIKNENAWQFLSSGIDVMVLRSILYDFDDWSFEPAYHLLENCGNFVGEDQFGYLPILEKIAEYRPEYSWAMMGYPLELRLQNDVSSYDDYNQIQLLKLLAGKIPEKMIPFLEQLIVDNLQWENIFKTPLVGDYTYTRIDLKDTEDLRGREYLYQLLAVCLRRAAAKQCDEFLTFLMHHETSSHKAMLRLIVFAVRTNEAQYSSVIYRLFCHLHNLNELIEGRDFRVEFRRVFGIAFPRFSDEQKAEVVQILKSLTDRHELYIYRNQNKPQLIAYWGKAKYSFLLKLPEDTVNADPSLKRQFQELVRKFGVYEDKSDLGPVLAGVVGRPLPEDAYSKMSIEQWLISFRRYSDDRDPFDRNFLKGGIHEHSNAFRNAAKNGDAEKMYTIVEKCLKDDKIKIIYPLQGVWGLVEAGKDIDRAIIFTKQFLGRPDIFPEIRYILYFIKDLMVGKNVDKQLLDFLISQSENYQDLRENPKAANEKTQISGLVTTGINTIHGSAAQALLYISDPKFEDTIFEVLQRLFTTAPPETRAALYFRFAHLNRLNRSRAYDLFCSSLLKETDIYVLASSIWSLHYMVNIEFERLRPIIEKLIASELLGDDDTAGLVSILYFSFIYDKPGSLELLFKMFENNPKSRRVAWNDGCKYFYFNQDSAEKTHLVLKHLVNNFANDKNEVLELSFYHIDHIKLPDICDVLELYINSDSFSFSNNFLNYLTQQCSHDVLLSVKIFNHAMSKRISTQTKREYLSDKHAYTKFVVGAYTALNGRDKIKVKYRRELLESFDVILKDYRYKSDTERILEDLL